MRKPPFPIAYIILIIGKRERSVRGRLKGLNSVAIKLIIKVIHITVKFIKIFIRISIRRQRKARRNPR